MPRRVGVGGIVERALVAALPVALLDEQLQIKRHVGIVRAQRDVDRLLGPADRLHRAARQAPGEPVHLFVELIRRLRLATIARQKVQVFNSALDTRYAKDHIVSHDLAKIPSRGVGRARDILELVEPETQVVGVDEVQFFDEEVVEVCEALADQGRRVIVAGLDTDYLGRPFEPMPRLLAVAEEITKLLAICVRCGNPAVHTQRLFASEELIVVGATGMYEARCRRCFESQLAHEKAEAEQQPAPDKAKGAAS